MNYWCYFKKNAANNNKRIREQVSSFGHFFEVFFWWSKKSRSCKFEKKIEMTDQKSLTHLNFTWNSASPLSSCLTLCSLLNFSRTLTHVYDAILEDLVFPAEIVGKRIRVKLDGKQIIKVHLDKTQQTNIEHKVSVAQIFIQFTCSLSRFSCTFKFIVILFEYWWPIRCYNKYRTRVGRILLCSLMESRLWVLDKGNYFATYILTRFSDFQCTPNALLHPCELKFYPGAIWS